MQDLLRNEEKTNGRWTKEEHLKFLEGLRIYGKNWKKIEQLVVTRSGSQIRSHAQKFFLKSKSTSFGSFNDLQLGSPEQQEMQETQTVISKSMGESSWKCEDLSYFLTKIIECSTQKNHFDFWNVLVDSCGKVSEIQSYRNRKNSFVGYSDQETVLSNVEKADKALL